ncbi:MULTISPECIES: FecR domain-containing protein [unclassified Ensifer]|uniref:FecR domain-containing protein n=1 Tax=unclassified Ensifer TaxID=2633371 RepID=UPI000813A159|nr:MULTISPECIES: FecR domain-containing protein [unclassified Ensifer]OCP02780.1 TonB-dependent receptor [Ensifer sp. LC14]OCP13681.1 TonB-dependent receptor [Ensifer sp. LC13]OCP14338.1 TonB-dependent receptor [Ensifer sp. LC11]OCP29044.1 TonB-dependent receptor [Ensifer sp. LC499]
MGRQGRRVLFAAAAILCPGTVLADPLPRTPPVAGSVIARKSGEEVRFVDVSNWRFVDLAQDLLSGDVLRTNTTGALAILFSDHTQVRLGRNTALRVKHMGTDGDTNLELESGTIWARAERGGQGLAIDTPAATAAIRGTDWTLTVGPDGKTSLIVLEGVVELSNAQGSVTVAQGEGAVAAIGKAPSKVVVVNPKDREQMLFHLSLRDSFVWMPATPLRLPDMRDERQRIEAKPAGARSTEEWLTLSEIYLSLDGRQKAQAALVEARQRRLSGTQRARADLVDALIAGSENRYDEAARLFARSARGLDAKRRAIAAYGGYFARSLADPDRVEAPPGRTAGAYGAMAKAWTNGFRDDIRAAIETLKQAERQYPDDPTLPAARARFALLLDDRAQVRDGIEKALAIDPEDPTALEARSDYRFHYENDLEGALADLQRGLKTAPGSSSLWNALGLVQGERGDDRAAEKAFKQAIALDPNDPVSHANLSILYLDENRMSEAKAEIDAALAADPSFDVTLVARGRYHMQTGELDKALADLLAGSTANPAYSNAQLLLAGAYYEKGDRIPAAQALDNADRLDPNDPVVMQMRTAIAIDEYDSDAAIRYAQELMRRTRARGGESAALGANQDAGSTLNDAFRLQGLNAWGQYYGDAVFDPFTGSSYVDQAVRGSVNPLFNDYDFDGSPVVNTANPLSFSAFFQGLLIEPHMLVSRERSANIVQRPFFEAALGGGIIADNDHTGWIGEAELRAYNYSPFPISVYGNIRWEEPRDTIDLGQGLELDRDTRLLGGNGYLTASPTPDDRIVAYANYADFDDAKSIFDIPDPRAVPFGLDALNDDSSSRLISGVAWSHTFGYRNIANAAFFFSDQNSVENERIRLSGLPLPDLATSRSEEEQRTYVAAVNHLYGDGDFTWRYGIEGGVVRSSSTFDIFDPLGATTGNTPLIASTSTSASQTVAKAYVDTIYEITPDLKAEGALFARYIEGVNDGDIRLEPKLGIAWAPAEGHWLRAAAMRDGLNFDVATLAPIGIVGLQPNQLRFGPEGYADTLALRWDAEWNDWFFTALDYQHQEVRELALDLPLSTINLDYAKVGIDRVAATTNFALGYGFGLALTAAHTEADVKDSSRGFAELLFVPENTAQVALTWVNTANIKATIAANYVGSRPGDGQTLDAFWTLDASLKWEPFDKQVEVDLAAFNLLDEDFDLRDGLPGWGPTFKGTIKVRF